MDELQIQPGDVLRLKAELPKAVRIGAFDFEIVEWNREHADDLKLWGQTNFEKCRIRIDMHSGRRRAASTFLHEVLHCVWRQQSIDDDDNEERTIRALERGLSAVWRDNPAVFAWIGAALTEGEDG